MSTPGLTPKPSGADISVPSPPSVEKEKTQTVSSAVDSQISEIVSSILTDLADNKVISPSDYRINQLKTKGTFDISKEIQKFISQAHLKKPDLSETQLREKFFALIPALQSLKESEKPAESKKSETISQKPELKQEDPVRWKENVSKLFSKIKSTGSHLAEERLTNLGINQEKPLTKIESDLISAATQLANNLESAKSVDELHQILASFRNPTSELAGHVEEERGVELHSTLKTFLQFTVGLKTIDLLFANFPDEHHIVKEFYKDEKHPMDVQRFLRNPDKSVEVANVVKNLSLVLKKLDPKLLSLLKETDEKFNQFIKSFIFSLKTSTSGLLDIQTIPADITKIGIRNDEYYQKMGLQADFVAKELSFSTKSGTKGIYLHPKGEEPAGMKEKKSIEAEGFCYLRVPDADNRVVRISKDGLKALRTIQQKNAKDLIDIQKRLSTLFPSPFVVTARTKSDLGILDKTGRLCKMTQGDDVPKYQTTKDIIDINGCRITCTDSSEMARVIKELETNGFEFLELDNKYNTIRKDGAYKVIPTTVRDGQTGAIFELQLTTMASTILSDISHNVIYKKEAIGLDVSDDQRSLVQQAKRVDALIETFNISEKIANLITGMNPAEVDKVASVLNQRAAQIKVA